MGRWDPAVQLGNVKADPAPVLYPFFGHKPEVGATQDWMLSNWAPLSFRVNNVSYEHMEQFMMAAKARLFKDKVSFDKIMKTSSQKVAKDLGRKVEGFDQGVWDANCYKIVVSGLIAKFMQNRAASDFLATSAPHVLVEASPWDRNWGVGLAMTSSDVFDPPKWRGRNLLGFALTETRFHLYKI